MEEYEIDEKDLIEYIHKRIVEATGTRLSHKRIKAVLDIEMEYLEKKGIAFKPKKD